MISRLLLLGATGDLAGRFLLPALGWLAAAGELPDDLQVVGAAAQDGDDASFRASVDARWNSTAGDLPDGARRAVLGRLRYRRFDADDPATVAAAAAATSAKNALRARSAHTAILGRGPDRHGASVAAAGLDVRERQRRLQRRAFVRGKILRHAKAERRRAVTVRNLPDRRQHPAGENESRRA